MIKNKEGQISGPYSTQKVIHLIHTGSLTDAEKVSEYPSGLWKILSQCPQFYDALFFALANKKLPQKATEQVDMDHSNTNDSDQKNQDQSLVIDKDLPENSIESKDYTDVLSSSQSEEIIEDENSQEVLIENIVDEDISSKEALSKNSFNEDVILDQDIFKDLNDNVLKDKEVRSSQDNSSLKNHNFISHSNFIQSNTKLPSLNVPVPSQKKKKKVSRRKPKVLFLSFFILMSYFLFWDESLEDQKSVTLIFPDKFNIGQISQADIKKQFQKNLQMFHKTTYHDYVKVQQQLVNLAEQASDVPDILGLLCLTYRELWPYSQKTNQDQEAISRLSQRISKVQAIGIHQDVCNIVKYLLSGQTNIVIDLINKSLGDHPNVPVLYELKAETLAKDEQYNDAIAYIQKAQGMSTMWKSWLKLYIKEAEYKMADKKFTDANNILRQLNSKVPSHALISVLLGYLNLEFLDKPKKGVEQIRQGLQSDEVLLPTTYSKMALALAKYYKEQQNKKLALEFAQKSYQKSSLNRSAKEIILELGGPKALQSIQTTDHQLVHRGNMFFEKGMFVEAQAQYKAAYEQNRKNAIAAMKAGQCLWKLNLKEDSVNWIRKALASDHKLTEAYVTLSDYLSQKHHFDAAIRVLLRAMKKVPQNHKIFRSMALLELRRHNYKSAESFAKKALKLHDTDIETNILLSQILYKMRKYQEAFHAIAKTLEISGQHHIQAQGLYSKIIAALQGEDFGMNYISDLIHTYPNVVDYQIALAEIYLFHRKYSKTEQILKKAMGRYPKNKKIQILLGEVYSKMADHAHTKHSKEVLINKALKAYVNAAIIDPIDATPLFQIGLIYMKIPDNEEKAIKQFQRVLKINEKYPKAYFHKGTAYWKLGKSNEALSAAKKEKQINPSLAEPYLLAGNVYMDNSKYNKAILEFQRAIKISPQGGQIYISLAKAYRLSNSFDVAEKMITRAKNLEKDGNPNIYKEEGEIYEGKGEIQRAIGIYELYIQLFPNAHDKQAIRSKISQLSQQ